MGSNHLSFGWARNNNLLGELQPPTFWVGSNHQLFGGLEPTAEADDEGMHKKVFFQHDQIFTKVSVTQQKQLVVFFLQNKNAKMHLM